MKIQCENCAIQHELDPPAWVVSSGRPFRFRCSSCGHSQSVQPRAEPDPPAPVEASPASTPPQGAPSDAAPAEARPADPAPSATAAASQRAATRFSASPGPSKARAEPESSVFLKQSGQIYMVRDWATLQRWIRERRVDKHDLVSEGGVRWEPVASRPDLLACFDELEPETWFDAPADGGAAGAPRADWHDDDTEGIPVGLPPLTEEIDPLRSGAEAARDAATPPAGGTFDLRFDEPAPPALLETPRPVDPAREAPPAPAEAARTPDTPDAAPAFDPFTTPELLPEANEPSPPPVTIPRPSQPAGAAPEPSLDLAVDDLDLDAEWEAHRRAGQSNRTVWVVGAAAVLVAVLGVWWLAPGGTEPETGDLAATLAPERAPAEAPADAEPEAPAGAPVDAEPAPTQKALVDEAPEDPPPAEPVAETAPPPAAPAEAATRPPPEPAPKPAPAPEPVPEATPKPVAEAAPEPAPKPAAEPAPKPPPSGASTAALVAQAWNQVDSAPDAAAQAFQQVLARNPGDNEANYGFGYVRLQQGDTEAGRRHLCRALQGASIDIEREVRGLLQQRGLACE